MRVGVIRYWADRPAAEHEVIARLAAAAAARGHELVELNPDGTSLGGSGLVPQLDLVLNLHYSSPKSLDVPHVGALWNPLGFYHDFGFVPHFANQLSHDWFATCGSSVLEAAVAPFRPDVMGPGRTVPVLNHSVPHRYLQPTARVDRRLFYVGVNWEKLGAPAGRHDRLLGILDGWDVPRIYGPRVMDGVEPWGGFRTYQGELPFDGFSVVEAIASAGCALIVSSPGHYRDLVMSSRPFEAAAAGVPMISERHPFMVEHFSDAALFFDERAPIEEQAEEIRGLLERLNADPELGLRLGRRGQEVLALRFDLDQQFDAMVGWVLEQEAAASARRAERPAPATAVVVPFGDAEHTGRWLRANAEVLAEFDEVLLAAPDRGEGWREQVASSGVPARVEVPTRADTGWSERAAGAVEGTTGPVCFLTATEVLFRGYPSAVRAVAAAGGAALVPGVLLPQPDERGPNERLPRLLAGTTNNWWELPVAGIATSGTRVQELRALLGPGLHLGVLAAEAQEQDAVRPAHSPLLRVLEAEHEHWSLGQVAGKERHRDASYAQALPKGLVAGLPASLLQQDALQGPSDTERVKALLSSALRRSPLPRPIKDATRSLGRSVLRAGRARLGS